jgi:hypothetical protein
LPQLASTMIFLISASGVARITSMTTSAWLDVSQYVLRKLIILQCLTRIVGKPECGHCIPMCKQCLFQLQMVYFLISCPHDLFAKIGPWFLLTGLVKSFLFFFFFCGMGVWTQCFALIRQELYCLTMP